MPTKRPSPRREIPTVPVPASGVRPEFVRLPAPGAHCPHTGLMRDTICRLVKGGHVKSVSLREPGTKRGARLIEYASLIGYLRSQMEAAAS